MTEPFRAASLHPGLIGLPARSDVDGLLVERDIEQVEPRWREDLRFFLICYFTAFCAFLFLLG